MINPDLKIYDIFIGDKDGGYSSTCLAFNKKLAVYHFLEDPNLDQYNGNELEQYVREVNIKDITGGDL